MAVQTRNITVTIFDNDGEPLEGAPVEIKLIGLGNEPGGAVSPGIQRDLTNSSGIASFTLWENRLDYSDTYYEVSSFHPVTGVAIHKREPFYVGDADADVKDLINIAAVTIDPTASLLAQIAADKAQISAAVSTATTAATTSSSAATVSTSAATTSTTNSSAATAAAAAALAAQIAAEEARDEAIAGNQNSVGLTIDYNIYSFDVESA